MSTPFVAPLTPGAVADDPQATRFSWTDATQRNAYVGLLALVALLVFSYWHTLVNTAAFWEDDQYSHGYIVPLIGLYLLWSRRPNPTAQEPPEGASEETFFGLMPASLFAKFSFGLGFGLAGIGWFAGNDFAQGIGLTIACVGGLAYTLIGQPFAVVSAAERWAGLALIGLAFGLRVGLGAVYYMEPVSRVSFIIALLGALVLMGGWRLIKWAGGPFAFLIFMFPLPSVVEQNLLLRLQKLAAFASEVVLTILSQPVIREGNKIYVDGIPLEVAEACSGLRMVTIFGAMAVALVMITSRPWWDKLIILLSAIPIALIVNITRIVATALLYPLFAADDETAHKLIHDWAGLMMMPLAMGLLYLELKVLSALTVEDEGIDLGHGGLGGEGGFAATAPIGR